MIQSPPVIPRLTDPGESRPYWSVMIPTFRPGEKYLRQALESVLRQDPGSGRMQIEVVDDCSPDKDVQTLVKKIGGDRVAFSTTPKNLGLAGCWNFCIERARGQWVHILHQDDYVLPGFYERLAKAAEKHPEVSLLATRSFFVDAEGVIGDRHLAVSVRLPQMENGGEAVDEFFYATPIQCPGVTVKRSFYESHGGFRPDLTFSLDREMWARVIGLEGGLVTPEVLACYRLTVANETGRLKRSAEGLRDLDRLNQLYRERYPGFDFEKARERVCYMAINQAEGFAKSDDAEAATVNFEYWKRNAPPMLRLRRFAVQFARKVFG